MRLASIIRRSLPTTPLRAGIPPTWDRPDPPSTQRQQPNQRLDMQAKHFTFFDASSPLYMVVNTEVAEGSPLEIFPTVMKRLGYLLLAAFFVGSLAYLWGSKQKVQTITNYLGQKQRLETEKKQKEQKYGLKDLINNPWKLNSLPETFPLGNYGVLQLTDEYVQKTKAVDAIRQVNKEALNYWNALYQQSEKKVKSGANSHGHH